MKNIFTLQNFFKILMLILVIVIFFAIPLYKIYKLTKNLGYEEISTSKTKDSVKDVISNLDKNLEEFLKY